MDSAAWMDRWWGPLTGAELIQDGQDNGWHGWHGWNSLIVKQQQQPACVQKRLWGSTFSWGGNMRAALNLLYTAVVYRYRHFKQSSPTQPAYQTEAAELPASPFLPYRRTTGKWGKQLRNEQLIRLANSVFLTLLSAASTACRVWSSQFTIIPCELCQTWNVYLSCDLLYFSVRLYLTNTDYEAFGWLCVVRITCALTSYIKEPWLVVNPTSPTSQGFKVCRTLSSCI